MNDRQKAFFWIAGILLIAFCAVEILRWVRVLQVTPYSHSCGFTLMKLASERAIMRPFFALTFSFSLLGLEVLGPEMPKPARFPFVATLGLALALLLMP